MYEPSIEEIIEMTGMEDVKAELDDSRYGNRKHGSRATSALGCTGPLCRYAEKARSRARTEKKAKRQGREYEPSEGHRLYDRDDLLKAVIQWHEIKLMESRIRVIKERAS